MTERKSIDDNMTDDEVIIEALIFLLEKESVRISDDKEYDRAIDLINVLRDVGAP